MCNWEIIFLNTYEVVFIKDVKKEDKFTQYFLSIKMLIKIHYKQEKRTCMLIKKHISRRIERDRSHTLLNQIDIDGPWFISVCPDPRVTSTMLMIYS